MNPDTLDAIRAVIIRRCEEIQSQQQTTNELAELIGDPLPYPKPEQQCELSLSHSQS